MPMFTQKHYVPIAQMIHAKRVAVHHGSYGGGMSEHAVRLDEINALICELVKLFKQDNPKFRELIFIEACCKDLRDA